MRILFLALDVDLARSRGDSVHAVELARALRGLDHDVSLVVGGDGPSRSLLPSDVPVNIVRGPDWSVLRAVRRLAHGVRPNVVYERRTTPKIGFAVRSLVGVPLVLEVNGVLREERSYGTGLPRGRVKGAIRNAMFRRVDSVVAVSAAVQENLVASVGVDPSKVHVIGNGVDTARFAPVGKESACAAAGLPVIPRVAFVGNLVGWRDFEVALKALGTIRTSVPNVELLMVGGGTEEGRVRRNVHEMGLEEAVRFVGEVTPDRVPGLVAASDIGLLPERPRDVDISPLKLFEYLACGRPVVASRVRGLELVEELEVGRLYTPGDHQELAAACRDLIATPSLRREMGVRGRAFVERERSWSAVAQRVTDVLEETIRRAS